MCLKKEGKYVWKCYSSRSENVVDKGGQPPATWAWSGWVVQPLWVWVGWVVGPSWAWSVERLSCCCCFAQFTSGVVYLNWNSIPWIDSEHKKNLPFRKDFREIPFSGLYSFAFEDCLWIRGCSHWELMLGKGAQNKSPRTEPIFKKEHF